MPRKSRIDAPGALHHIIARAIDRRKIFQTDEDRDNFLSRLGDILKETKTECYAWALIPNHFHLLLRTSNVSISTVMRRLLTGYAIWYNRRHRRFGHLFQNRYKSILCQQDVYLLELVRYIHLNPLRAGLVADLRSLDSYPYSGHSVLMAKVKYEWQNTDKILKLFGEKTIIARHAYREYVNKGIEQGKRSDLTGGGLVRSVGGWTALKALRAAKVFEKADERILGDGEFVESVLKAANEAMERKYDLQARGFTLSKVASRVAEVMGIEQQTVWAAGRHRDAVQARSLLCYWAVRELGIPMISLSRRLDLSVTAIAKAVIRGEKLANVKKYSLIDK
ncbi:MAG: transposase [Deltaproteobacteria bacterium]|nr:transposase [Deltaproteobacteria bacterium]MBW1959918.1 transposase [Deltaproteobacteria bacterium]MBW2150431.1 transposase [Deltaproteobacteria bacterium]